MEPVWNGQRLICRKVVTALKKILCLAICAALLLCSTVPAFASSEFRDVPGSSWAAGVIDSAVSYGLVQGWGNGVFGYGESVKRAEFVTVLCCMLGWETASPAEPSFSDVADGKWYFGYVEAALANDAIDGGGCFRPEDAITREEMAVMLVRALGYRTLAEAAERTAQLPFTDVDSSRGYICAAYDIGMINGRGGGIFAPDDTATREEMAAMLVRVYEKLKGETQWVHGFYAFSSYAQRYTAQDMDAVSVGWSRMCCDSRGVWLNTGTENSNEWRIPDSYESIIDYLDSCGTAVYLNVYMDNSSGEAAALLTSRENREAAVDAIIAELTRNYPAVGRNPYSGVTIDFEGLYGESMREGLTQFLTLLRQKLDTLGKGLYTAVQPVAENGYFDGYDFRAIGELADKVILMAHDYNATDLSGFVGTEYYRTTAQTPLSAVYVSLRAATDAETGVADRSKLCLALSCSAMAWRISGGKLADASPVRPTTATVYKRLAQDDTVIGWSDTYKNPYAVYSTEDGSQYFLWYENERSIDEKLTLARLFGINSVSVWRIGEIPDYADEGLEFNAWAEIR